MKYCQKCGRAIRDGHRSCDRCRNELFMKQSNQSGKHGGFLTPKRLLRMAELLLLTLTIPLLLGDPFYGCMLGEEGSFSLLDVFALGKEAFVWGGGFLLFLLGAYALGIWATVTGTSPSYAGFISLMGAGIFYLISLCRILELASGTAVSAEATAIGNFVPGKILAGGYTVLLLIIAAAVLEILAKNINTILEKRKRRW